MRWLREVRAVIGDGDRAISIEDLYIGFRVRRETSGTPAEGHVEVANLSASNERHVRERGSRVQLFAGHRGNSGLILDGDVRRVARRREGLDRMTVVYVGGNVVAQTSSGAAFFNRSYGPGTSVRSIAKDIVDSWTGFSIGPQDPIPPNATVDEWSYAGPSGLAMTELLEPFGLRWYEEHGLIKFTSSAQVTPAPTPVTTVTTGRIHVISEATGMIESPTITEDGMRVRTILNHQFSLDDEVEVRSIVTEGESLGRQKIVLLEHRGDNRQGDFHTDLEIRPVEQPAQ